MIYFTFFFINRLKITPDCTTELNHHAYLFLQSTFDKHDLVSFRLQLSVIRDKCFSVNNVALFTELLDAHVMCAKSLQSCVAFCDPMDSSPLGFSVQGVL